MRGHDVINNRDFSMEGLSQEEKEEVERHCGNSYQKQRDLDEYAGVFWEYNELILQLCNVVMFACALPISSVFAWISTSFERQVDATKMLELVRRPVYEEAFSLGLWTPTLQLINMLAACTNVAYLFTYTTLPDYAFRFFSDDPLTGHTRWLFGLAVEHALLLLILGVDHLFPDAAEIDLQQHLQRKIQRSIGASRERVNDVGMV